MSRPEQADADAKRKLQEALEALQAAQALATLAQWGGCMQDNIGQAIEAVSHCIKEAEQ